MSAPLVHRSSPSPSGIARQVTAVVLAYNGAATLPGVFSTLAAQTLRPGRVVAVDNGSSDGSAAIIAGTPLVDAPVLLEHNTGVGAGHTVGLQTALRESACELVWVLEHDSMPTATCLEVLMRALPALQSRGTKVGVLSPRVVRVPGAPPAPRGPGTFEVRRCTFNGILLTREAVSAIGYPRSDFFVGGEDTEYASRLRAAGFEIWRVADALVEHHRLREFTNRRSYYAVRNAVFARTRLSDRAFRRLRAVAWASAGAVKCVALLRWRLAAARVTGMLDGMLGRMGPRDYWFMRSRRGGSTQQPRPASDSLGS